MKAAHRRLLVDLLTLPTAPFNEQHVVAYIRAWVAKRANLKLTQDRFGNLQIRLRRGRTDGRRPLVLAAHMDHPGFEAERMIRPGLLRAHWRGGVPDEYFVGTPVRFFIAEGKPKAGKPAGRWLRGTVRKIIIGELAGRRRVTAVEIAIKSEVPAGCLGMWDLPDPVIRGTRLFARGCDDVAGVAAVLGALDELSRRREPVDVIAMLNRAEEVGFSGAMAACRAGVLPRGARMISVECSSELAGGRMGEGPILRVGDATTIFTPELTAFCRQVGQSLAGQRRTFRFQRKLMDGGTCEASAFLGYGFETSGLCIALGNYHNVDRVRGRIAPEFVDLADWQGLLDWFVALAIEAQSPPTASAELNGLLERLYVQWTPLLEATASRVS